MARREMVAARTAWSNRQAAPGAAAVMAFTAPLVACLDAQLYAIDAAIERLIAASQPLAQTVRCLCGIAGIGAKTAAALVALMPELGTLGRRQAAALAGLAPHPNQSGQSDRYRRTRGGRLEVKRALFMAALSAARHHPALHTFHQRLIARGSRSSPSSRSCEN
jgi:transposase